MGDQSAEVRHSAAPHGACVHDGNRCCGCCVQAESDYVDRGVFCAHGHDGRDPEPCPDCWAEHDRRVAASAVTRAPELRSIAAAVESAFPNAADMLRGIAEELERG